jgi:AcrR family transcriptional regulator
MPKAIAQDAGTDTRERLLRAARRVMAEQGWSAVTTRGVAAAADVNPGLVHYHFGSVADLRREAVTSVLRDLGAGAATAMPGGEVTAAGLRELLTSWLEEQRRDPQASAVLMHGSLACLHDAALREEVRSMLAGYRAATQQWLTGQGHPPDSAREISVLISAALDGVFLHSLIDPGTDPTDIIEPLLHLAAAPPPTAAPPPPSTKETP